MDTGLEGLAEDRRETSLPFGRAEAGHTPIIHGHSFLTNFPAADIRRYVTAALATGALYRIGTAFDTAGNVKPGYASLHQESDWTLGEREAFALGLCNPYEKSDLVTECRFSDLAHVLHAAKEMEIDLHVAPSANSRSRDNVDGLVSLVKTFDWDDGTRSAFYASLTASGARPALALVCGLRDALAHRRTSRSGHTFGASPAPLFDEHDGRKALTAGETLAAIDDDLAYAISALVEASENLSPDGMYGDVSDEARETVKQVVTDLKNAFVAVEMAWDADKDTMLVVAKKAIDALIFANQALEMVRADLCLSVEECAVPTF